MRKVLRKKFFERKAPIVARDLLGKYLVRQKGARVEAYILTEVEAYDGFRDRASHASRGQTPRNVIMFGDPGHLYVYFTYGMHWMLNVVTGKKGYPSAVLIRGVLGVTGPARLTKKLNINKHQNGLPISRRSGIWFEDRGVVTSSRRIIRTPRIGVDSAGKEWAGKKWRFVLTLPPPRARSLKK